MHWPWKVPWINEDLRAPTFHRRPYEAEKSKHNTFARERPHYSILICTLIHWWIEYCRPQPRPLRGQETFTAVGYCSTRTLWSASKLTDYTNRRYSWNSSYYDAKENQLFQWVQLIANMKLCFVQGCSVGIFNWCDSLPWEDECG